MPSILLINDNKIVSRLLQLSSQKHSYNLEEINDYTPAEGSYNVVFIDSEKFDESAWEVLKSTISYDKLGFIGDKTNSKPEGFDFILEKPFLPTDFVTLMTENFKVMTPEEEAEANDELEEMEDVESEYEEEMDLDNLEEMDTLEEIESIDEVDMRLDEDLDGTGDNIAKTTLTTGIAETVVQHGEQEELSEIMNEIDEMETEEVLEEMDLDALVEDKVVDSIVDEEIVKETLQEVEESMEAAKEVIVEDSAPSNTGTIAAGVAATVAAVSSVVLSKEEEKGEEFEEALNILDGVEAIENEDDYLVENDHKVQDLADEFDSLNEEEVEKLMAGEEVVSEEYSVAEEKVVESNDLEEMITRAVSKAITQEMLKEALKDMEIVVSLKAKSKDS